MLGKVSVTGLASKPETITIATKTSEIEHAVKDSFWIDNILTLPIHLSLASITKIVMK